MNKVEHLPDVEMIPDEKQEDTLEYRLGLSKYETDAHDTAPAIK